MIRVMVVCVRWMVKAGRNVTPPPPPTHATSLLHSTYFPSVHEWSEWCSGMASSPISAELTTCITSQRREPACQQPWPHTARASWRKGRRFSARGRCTPLRMLLMRPTSSKGPCVMPCVHRCGGGSMRARAEVERPEARGHDHDQKDKTDGQTDERTRMQRKPQ